jgi:hypothetical protein
MQKYDIRLCSGKPLRFCGRCHAAADDGHYERLKRRLRQAEGAPEKTVEVKGRSYAVYEADNGKWFLVTTYQTAIGYPDRPAELRPDAPSDFEHYNSEHEVLEEIRDRMSEDPSCPFNNLLTSWGRDDLREHWIREGYGRQS